MRKNNVDAKNLEKIPHTAIIGGRDADRLLSWCRTRLSDGFQRIKFRFFSEFVVESSFSRNENRGISFERFLPIFQNPHACTGGKANKRSLRSAFRIIPAPAIPPPKKLKVYSRKTERKSNFLSTSKAQNWLQELQQYRKKNIKQRAFE